MYRPGEYIQLLKIIKSRVSYTHISVETKMKNLAKNESYRTRTLTRHRYKQENPINENCPHGHRQAHGKIKDEVPRHDRHKVTANEGQEHGEVQNTRART